MTMDIKILQSQDLESILNLEKALLEQEIKEEIEREMFSWKAPWRQEALEHYLQLGWSFGIWQENGAGRKLLAYFLGQPLVHFRGMTQSPE